MSVLFSAFWSVFPLAPVKCSVTGVCHVYRGACLSQVEGTRAHQHGLAGTHAGPCASLFWAETRTVKDDAGSRTGTAPGAQNWDPEPSEKTG